MPAAGTWTVIARRAWLADALTKVTAFCDDDERTALVAALAHMAAAILATVIIVQHVATAQSGVPERRSGMDRRY